MKEPHAPYLELSFYFARQSETEALAQLIIELVKVGAKFTGKANIHRGNGIREHPFSSITDERLEVAKLEGFADLTQYLEDPNIRLMQILMDAAAGTKLNTADIVTYLEISPESARTDHHPLAIWTSGDVFAGALRKRYAKRAKEVGRQTYQHFRGLVETLRPSYGAITSAWPLECPDDLRRDSRSLAFRNFFISHTYIGDERLSQIQELFSGTYREAVGDGVYISCTEEFNPQGIFLDNNKASWLSVEVAKLIASVDRK